MEKCAGIAKADKNDRGTGKHALPCLETGPHLISSPEGDAVHSGAAREICGDITI